MMQAIVNVLGTLTVGLCAFLLLRAYARVRKRLLLWSGLCFAGLTLANALPNTIAMQLAAFGSSNISLGPCRLLLDFPLLFLATPLTDAAGAASAPLPIPNDPSLVGTSLFFQWGVLDPVGPLFGSIAASRGLQVAIGQ